MYDLAQFRQRVQELCRRSYPYESNKHATQRDLAEAVGLHPTELSKRLNGARALNSSGLLTYLQGDEGLAKQLLEQSLELQREAGE